MIVKVIGASLNDPRMQIHLPTQQSVALNTEFHPAFKNTKYKPHPYLLYPCNTKGNTHYNQVRHQKYKRDDYSDQTDMVSDLSMYFESWHCHC